MSLSPSPPFEASEPLASVLPGRPAPLGATYDGRGVNFSLFSEVAARVELCLFDEAGNPTESVDLPEVTALCWHGYLPGVRPGQRYGYRVHGPWDPDRGQRCNPAKLLLDPYAKAVDGGVTWDEAVFPYRFDDPEGSVSDLDSAPFVPRSVVVDPGFDWGDDRSPHTSWHKTVIYETHVKGLTARHPGVPPELRGTYAGLAHPAVTTYLRDLGVTAVELMPVHQFLHDGFLEERALRNYWGYSSIGYFAPHDEYAADPTPGGGVREFKAMVKALHRAGLEVILDVVYNHTSEGHHLGPMLSLKGIDNAAYYRLVPDAPRYYMDYTGTGNTLNMRHPHTLQLVMDSLRYWVQEMHVDGFRFDLAATLARGLHEVDKLSSFFDIIQQDPVISRVKLIAEPWDLGEGGYQVGNFPPLWSEWNAEYRDTVRDFWRGEAQTLGEFAYRLTGSSDLYQATARRPYASINFVTAHDGFTLRDLVSYDRKHNVANGEQNRDGLDHNRSWNCGVEGTTNDPEVEATRRRQQRNFLATLLLSQGVPMLLGGDEIGRTQAGNNNAYCQDDEVSWYDWGAVDEDLLRFVRRLIRLRREHPVLRRRHWFRGRAIHGADVKDIAWFTPGGQQMKEEHWGEAHAKSVAVFLDGRSVAAPGGRRPRNDDRFYLAFHAHHEPIDFTLPGAAWARAWHLELDTGGDPPEDGGAVSAGATVRVEGRSLVVLRSGA